LEFRELRKVCKRRKVDAAERQSDQIGESF